jgi:hypothetical protein
MHRTWTVGILGGMVVLACGSEPSTVATGSEGADPEDVPEDDVKPAAETGTDESESGGEPPDEEVGSSSGDEVCDDCEPACDGDEDCDVGSVCDVGLEESACMALPMVPACFDTHPIRLGELETGSVTSVSFVDVDEDGLAELAIGRPSGLDLLLPGSSEPMSVLASTEGQVLDVVAGDFTGDGIGDLLVAESNALTLIAGSGSGGFAGSVPTVRLPAAPRKLATLRWDGSGADDAAVLLQSGSVEVRLGGDPWGSMLLLDAINGTDLAVGDVDADELEDVAVESDGRTPIFFGNAENDDVTDLTLGRDGRAASGIAAGFFVDPKPTTIARHREMPGGWTIVEGGHDEATFRPQALLATGIASAAGDIDGDGFDDLVLIDSFELTVARGGATFGALFQCATSHGLTTPASMVAVGDRDGDGRAEIATTHGGRIEWFGMPQ